MAVGCLRGMLKMHDFGIRKLMFALSDGFYTHYYPRFRRNSEVGKLPWLPLYRFWVQHCLSPIVVVILYLMNHIASSTSIIVVAKLGSHTPSRRWKKGDRWTTPTWKAPSAMIKHNKSHSA